MLRRLVILGVVVAVRTKDGPREPSLALPSPGKGLAEYPLILALIAFVAIIALVVFWVIWSPSS